MKQLIIATGNANKVREFKEILGDTFTVLSMKDAGIESDPDENGTTFAENALIKAKSVAEKAPDAYVLADDSGLEIDALNKEPGIYSARYLGEDTSYDIKNAKLLERLEGVEDADRTARFVCAMASIFPDGSEHVFTETMEGRIGYEIAGENGFCYDPIFIPDGYEKTSAELTPDEKNAISHRGKALRKTAEVLNQPI